MTQNRMFSTAPGLLLVPTPLDFGVAPVWPIEQTMPLGTLQAAAQVQHWVCENAKSLRAFLKRVDALVALAQPLQSISIRELPREVHKKGDHVGAGGSASFNAAEWLAPIAQGHALAFACEAGMPCVADPGSSLVRAAHAAGAVVRVLAGPSSLISALAASGLNGQQFAFVGYLPTDAQARASRIAQLENTALREGQTQLLIETPYRNQAVFEALVRTLKPNTRLAVAQGLHTAHEAVQSRTVVQWRGKILALPATPTVFLFGQ